MITVTYDPYHNPAVPDGHAMMMAETIINIENGQDPAFNNKVTVGTGLVIDALRLLVKQGKMPADQLRFKYNDTIITVDGDGRCDKWPSGFNDTLLRLLSITNKL